MADTAEQIEVSPARAGLEELALLCRLLRVRGRVCRLVGLGLGCAAWRR